MGWRWKYCYYVDQDIKILELIIQADLVGWLGWFYGISTFVGYFNAKSIFM